MRQVGHLGTLGFPGVKRRLLVGGMVEDSHELVGRAAGLGHLGQGGRAGFSLTVKRAVRQARFIAPRSKAVGKPVSRKRAALPSVQIGQSVGRRRIERSTHT